MPYDFLTGRPTRRNVFGENVPLNQYRREILANNKRKGKMAENKADLEHFLRGERAIKTGRGSDRAIYRLNLGTFRDEYLYHEEIKSGNAKLSALQQKTQRKKGKKFKVRRYSDDDLFF